jgi:galactofuranosylgalactofuranosylrhamnosyl-N-acetylglucosaminyl-diphospho-decaprenol beta-1,5/1,6-galactofuranosyltransferase
MEYSTMAIQIEAMKDFLAGPDQLFDILESSLPRIAKLRSNYSDAVIIDSADQLPAPTGAPGVPTQNIGGRLAKIKKIPWAVKGLKHLLSKEDPRHHEAPQLNLTPDEARWFTLSRVDSATVSTAGGTGVAFRKRDRDLARDLVEQTRELLSDIEDNFDEMRTEYRKALPELTSRESWRKIFE